LNDPLYYVGDVKGRKKRAKVGHNKDNAASAPPQGLLYIAFPCQSAKVNIFWSVIIFLLVVFGFYWCMSVYHGWMSNPVLTTIVTAAYPVENVSNRVIIN